MPAPRFLGLALAYLGEGRGREGGRAGRGARARLRDGYLGPYLQHLLVRNLYPGRRAGEGAGPARAAAADAYYLSPAGSDRSRVRPAPQESAIPEAGEGRRVARISARHWKRPWPGATPFVRELGRGGMPPSTSRAICGTTARSRSRSSIRTWPHARPERFLREIKAGRRCRHPHILTVLDSGDAGGTLWFTMPYVEGRASATGSIAEKQLSVEDAVRIARRGRRRGCSTRISTGVVHRDIKPGICCSPATATLSWRTSDRAGARRRHGSKLNRDGHRSGHAGVHEPGAAVAAGSSMPGPTYTGLGVVLYEMLAASRRSPDRRAGDGRAPADRAAALARSLRESVPDGSIRRWPGRWPGHPADRFATAASSPPRSWPAERPPRPLRRGSRRHEPLPGRPESAAHLRPRPRLSAGSGVLSAAAQAWHRDAGGTGPKLLAAASVREPGRLERRVLRRRHHRRGAGKAASLSGLKVIASSSASQYARGKSPQQIAKELVCPTCCWGRPAGRSSRGARAGCGEPGAGEVVEGSAPTTKCSAP